MRNMKSKLTDFQLAWVMFILSLLVLVVVLVDVIHTSELWFVGKGNKAHIVSLNHSSWSKSSGTMYHYDVEIDRKNLKLSLPYQLPIGSSIDVLVHPFDSTNFRVGDSNESFLNFLLGPYGADQLWVTIIKFCGLILMVIAPFFFLHQLITSRNNQ
jgi:hypothetical protein